MDERNRPPCLKEADLSDMKSDIKVMLKGFEEHTKQIDRIKAKYDTLNEINTAISVMSLTLGHIVEHNAKQDLMQEKRDEVLEHQNQTLVKVNQNLNELNQGVQALHSKVQKLEDRVDENDEKHLIDLRLIEKDKTEGFLKKYAGPVAVGIAIGALILQILKTLQ